MQKKNHQKNERKKYIMDYEYALLEKQRNRHINCSPGRDHNVDYRRAHSTERSSDDSAALLPTMWCQLQEASLSSVSCRLGGRLRKMQSITMAKARTMEEPRSCFLVQMKSGAVLPLGWTLVLAWWAWWSRRAFLLAHWRWAWIGGQGSWHFSGHTIGGG